MCKRGNYFLALYDKEDNYIMSFESIEECAIYFNFTKKNMYDYILKGIKINNEYQIFKFYDVHQDNNLNIKRK